MYKYLLYLAISFLFAQQHLQQTPDYRRVCVYIKQNLDGLGRAGLSTVLGKQSLEDVVTHTPQAAYDSIAHYVKPLNNLRLGGPYNYQQMDSAIRPKKLQIFNGIKKFEDQFAETKYSNKERIFALQVLIGLETAIQLPLQVSNILPRDEFIKHDIFTQIEIPNYREADPVALRLYQAYELGVRIAQAGDNKQMIVAITNRAYEPAGQSVAIGINDAFLPLFTERTEGSNWGKIIQPGKDPIYTFSARPNFPGGLLNFTKFMYDHLSYPLEEWIKGIEGMNLAQIVIEKDGSISQITIISPVSPAIDSEVVRVIKLSPKWMPGHLTVDGPSVRSQYTVITNFRIKPNAKREEAFNTSF